MNNLYVSIFSEFDSISCLFLNYNMNVLEFWENVAFTGTATDKYTNVHQSLKKKNNNYISKLFNKKLEKL